MKRTTCVTIRNDFHNTECTIRIKWGESFLTDSQVRRVRRTLCGIDDCLCGGVLSERGPQEWHILRLSDGIAIGKTV